MLTKYLLTITLLVLLTLGGLPAMGQDATSGLTTREQVDLQLNQYREQMEFSDYTWAQVEMILKSGVRDRVAIAKRYGLDGKSDKYKHLENKQRRAMKKELKKSHKFTEDRLKRYLDKEQLKEFKALQEEIQANLMEIIESGAQTS